MEKKKMPEKNSSNSPNLLRLYRLMSTMTPAQKRDFRKYSRFWGESRAGKQGKRGKVIDTPLYVQVFDSLNRFLHDEKDVAGLQAHLVRSLSISPRALADQAAYLYDGILESLRTTPDRGRMFNRLNSLMQDINTLHHKGLRQDAMLLVAQARKVAQKLDKPTYLSELLWWEHILQPVSTERHAIRAFSDSVRLEQEQISRHLNRINELRGICWVLVAETREVNADTTIVPENWRTLFELDIKKALDTISGFRAKTYFLSAVHHYGNVTSKQHPEQRQRWLEKIFEAQSMIISSYQGEEFGHFAQEEPANYWAALESNISLCHRLEKHKRANELMEIFLREADDHVQIYSRLNQYIANWEISAGIRYLEERRIAAKYPQFKEQMIESRQITICYQCGFLYFAVGKWEEAHRWFAPVIDGHRPNAHNVAVSLIGLLDIICTFELKTYGGSITRLLDNFEARQKRAGQWSGFVENLTEALKKHLTQPDDSDTLEHLNALQAQVRQNALLGMYGVVLAWIEARLHGTDYLSEVKKY